jgi:hypothetical protein
MRANDILNLFEVLLIVGVVVYVVSKLTPSAANSGSPDFTGSLLSAILPSGPSPWSDPSDYAAGKPTDLMQTYQTDGAAALVVPYVNVIS